MGFFDSKKIREFGYILYALFWNVLSSWLMFSNEGTLEELEEKNEKENVDYYIEVEKPGGRQQLKHRELETKGFLANSTNESLKFMQGCQCLVTK